MNDLATLISFIDDDRVMIIMGCFAMSFKLKIDVLLPEKIMKHLIYKKHGEIYVRNMELVLLQYLQ